MPVEEQIAILYCGTKGLLHNVPQDRIIDFQNNFRQSLCSSYKEKVLDVLKSGKLTEEVEATLRKVASDVAGQF